MSFCLTFLLLNLLFKYIYVSIKVVKTFKLFYTFHTSPFYRVKSDNRYLITSMCCR